MKLADVTHAHLFSIRAFVILQAVLMSFVASAQDQTAAPSTLITFDDPLQTPENITLDRSGNLYLSLGLTGEVLRLSPFTGAETYATLPTGSDGFIGGLALDYRGILYTVVSATDPADTGIWRIPEAGEPELVARLPEDAFPNGAAFSPDGHLYVADSVRGAIYRLCRGCTNAEVWLESDALLPGTDETLSVARGARQVPTPGANGVKYWNGNLYVSNTGKQTLSQVPILPSGEPGALSTYISGQPLDDFLVDATGNVYLMLNGDNEIVRVSPEGDMETLLTLEDGLANPTSAVLSREGETLFVANADYFTTPNVAGVLRLELR